MRAYDGLALNDPGVRRFLGGVTHPNREDLEQNNTLLDAYEPMGITSKAGYVRAAANCLLFLFLVALMAALNGQRFLLVLRYVRD